MTMQWYVLRVASGQEDRVRRGLETRVKAKKKRTMRKKIYPGYVIVEMDLDNDTRYLIRETPGVGDFIGTHGNPEPLSEDEVAKLMGQVQKDAEKPKLKIQFKAGDAVKIKEGPFENYDGVIDEVDTQKGAVRVVITVFNRPTPVELGYWQVEAI
jgi:transcriptional antiterminator NusG